MEKRILIDLGNVRVKEYDKYCVQVERFETVFNPKDRTNIGKWRFKAYSDTILNALKLIVNRTLLVDEIVVSDLKTYLKAIEESNEKVLEAIEGLKGMSKNGKNG